MDIHAILFDVNGTLIDILTDEHMPDIYRKIRNFLSYQGVYIHRTDLQELYFQLLKEQKKNSKETYPEFDAVAIWDKILHLKETEYTKALPPNVLAALPLTLAQLFRSASFCRKLRLYPDVQKVLDQLHMHYPLGIVTNAQSAYGLPELRNVGIAHYFNPIVISGDYGYCKPDTRLFQKAFDVLNVKPENTIFVGNDMFHDVLGAKQAGSKVVFFSSNQGDQSYYDVHPDYIIKKFADLPLAIDFLKKAKN